MPAYLANTVFSALMAVASLHGQPHLPLSELSITELEDSLGDIDARLDQLAHFRLQAGVGSNGYRSALHLVHLESHHTEWFEVQLSELQSIDQVILVPHLVMDNEAGLVSDGFPIELQIIAGTQEHPEGELIAQTKPKDGKQHIAPFIFPTPGLKASWIRIEAIELSARSWDGHYNFQLAEILIFQGDTNLALTSEVTTSSQSIGYDSSRDERYLVDGFMPYVMNAAIGAQSRAFAVDNLADDFTPELMIDLGEIYTLEQIHLHRLELGNNIPLSKSFDHGTPHRLLIEGATLEDFSDRSLLLDLIFENSYQTGPIIMRNLEGEACRFVRLSIIEPFLDTLMSEPTTVFGLAEIELFSDQTNVAYQKIPTANFRSTKPNRSLENLTDGHNFYGKILPIREWLEQLTERYELEVKRPLIRAELDKRYTQQTIMLRRMGWLAMLLTTGIVVIVLVDRIIRLRQIAQIRERFAADLHDDLGASLHAIGLLGDIALASTQAPDRLNTALTRSRELTKRMSATVRHGTNLQSIGRLESLEKDMQRIAERILVKISYEISTTGSDPLNKLKPRLKMDLLLFVKECLANIVKHSDANKVKIDIIASPNTVEIIVHDNGRGLPSNGTQRIPPSLKRRARIMNASISISHSTEFATIIHLIRKRSLLTFWK
jgi:signal transduction histidine kinase